MAKVVGSEASNTLMGYIAQMDNRLGDRSKREYTNRLKEMSKKIQRRTGNAETLTPDMLIEQISTEVTANGIADSTFRMYKSANDQKERFPIAANIASRVLCLPIFPELHADTIVRTAELIARHSITS